MTLQVDTKSEKQTDRINFLYTNNTNLNQYVEGIDFFKNMAMYPLATA